MHYVPKFAHFAERNILLRGLLRRGEYALQMPCSVMEKLKASMSLTKIRKLNRIIPNINNV